MILKTAYQTIKRYDMIKNNDSIVVGISGGADSISLFHFLYTIKDEYSINIIGVHINHGIRGKDANEDERFVKDLCTLYDVKCEVFKYDIHKEAKKLKVTEEEAGRIVRYKAFGQVLEKYNANKIAVAHNMNDQCETILLRIFRGTGLLGLTGIHPIRDNIIRPFIETTREDIENYCIENNIHYRQDYTNSMDIYNRNKIRIHIIPWIKDNFNKSIIQTISNMSSLLREDEQYIDNQATIAYKSCVNFKDKNKIQLIISMLNSYDKVIQKRIIRLCIYDIIQNLKDIELSHILSILNLLDKNTGKKVNITHGIVAEKQYNLLAIYIEESKINNPKYCYDIKLNDKLYIKEDNFYIISELNYKEFFQQKPNNLYTKVFDYDKIGSDIKIRTRLSGDIICLKGVGSKKLKDFFIDIKLPREQRDIIPLIAKGNSIIWIIGNRVSNQYNIDEDTKRILYIEYRR